MQPIDIKARIAFEAGLSKLARKGNLRDP